MKKLTLVAMGCIMALASCGKEEVDEETLPTPPSQLILGDWELEKIRYVEYEDGQKVYEDIDRDYLLLTFSSNTYLMREGLNDTADFGSYQLTADSLIMNGDDGGRFKLNALTKDYLEIFLSEEYTEDSTLYREEVTGYFDKK